jgi:CheY-like chemotaxis protein
VTAQLLAFSRRQILRPVPLDLNALVRSWEAVLRRTMGADCTVELRPTPTVAPILADPGQLEQVLLNLILNARDAMPRGGTVTVETFTAEVTGEYLKRRAGVAIRPGAYVVLAVSDTGHGMDRETLSRVFEPFFTTKGVGHGTGLGLSTVYGIVKQSNGYVWAYSEPGQGSTFKVYLPVAADAVPEPAPAVSPPVRTGKGESVLLVEDDPGVREMTRRALEEGGFKVEAANGRDALALLESLNAPIGLVLTDVVMPGIGGRELADRIELLHPGTPILFTSGYTDAEIVRRGLLDPAAAFIQKPFDPEAIVRVVRERVDGASLSSSTVPPPSEAAEA